MEEDFNGMAVNDGYSEVGGREGGLWWNGAMKNSCSRIDDNWLRKRL